MSATIGEILRDMAFVCAAAQLAVWVGCIIAWLRAQEPSPEDLERAAMRASSWPSA